MAILLLKANLCIANTHTKKVGNEVMVEGRGLEASRRKKEKIKTEINRFGFSHIFTANCKFKSRIHINLSKTKLCEYDNPLF